ncbi:MAG: 4Fe-4S dicluster domain-containing protein [Bacteroidota bacterium]|jgi:2-oxoglutarate ferredoxin oxidoreductase subunit delta|nr:4Fe-4S dicluster domain-containing protein [Bacteroidota bacterium]
MAKVRGDVSIDIEKCKGCELCVVACPQDALALSRDINKQGYHYAVLVEDVCTGCTNCSLVCPDAVITVYREDKKTGQKVPVAEIRNVTGDIKVTVGTEEEAGA